jgi:hypothetical protein
MLLILSSEEDEWKWEFGSGKSECGRGNEKECGSGNGEVGKKDKEGAKMGR